jgi:hypothetical protein
VGNQRQFGWKYVSKSGELHKEFVISNDETFDGMNQNSHAAESGKNLAENKTGRNLMSK